MKLFAISNQLLEHDLDKVEEEFALDLGRLHTAVLVTDDTYYPQIDRAIRQEAAAMSQHYEVFYSLEKTIRSLVNDTIVATDGPNWWTGTRAPARVKQEADSRLQKEIDSGVTVRSSSPLDFTTFGELGEVIKSNWDLFGSIFSSPKAVERVMANLNTLRGPIAHCSPLAEDEVVRLRLSVRDWFRLME
ncbi:Swt1 family HEPN domain-containing protein [Stenotrophomonas sp. HITSZ_GD]|uniref:Swt1 family HEPN domain-containing protein n=1 Tax=Stenotrophomonas sp. HITSZ_GD TaxID=3037248 RepID=UPI00240D161B|nr:Swt1 family HEPN domain-containing protein [Stenotrophomonas sp. HITSZ_GD]MDG2526578.1 Swt1 family HEPN domain-containing protein [Stenotrophomonas sp. HITSZ_GD]